MNEKKDLGAGSSNSDPSQLCHSLVLSEPQQQAIDRRELIRQYDEDYKMFPLPICFDPMEEQKELYRRSLKIEDYVDELLSSAPPTTTTPTATPVAQRGEDWASEASNSDVATVASQSVHLAESPIEQGESIWNILLGFRDGKYKLQDCCHRIQQMNMPYNREGLIDYIYEFAWHYGRLYHIGDAEKIKAAVSEKFMLPEEWLIPERV